MKTAQRLNIVLFGDQVSEHQKTLGCLTAAKHKPVLQSFLNRAHAAIRLEMGRLGGYRSQAPNVASLEDFLAVYAHANPDPAIESALTCLTHFGLYVLALEEGTLQLPVQPSQTFFAGICTGQLTAKAIAFAQSINQLLAIATETVLVAFRAGHRTSSVRSTMLTSLDSFEPWSASVNTSSQVLTKAIESFCDAKKLSSVMRPYISAYSEGNVTVSGRPDILQQLLQHPSLAGNPHVTLPIYAPYHAAHLYNDDDIRAILDGSSMDLRAIQNPRLGSAAKEDNLYSAFWSALHAIMIEPIDSQSLATCLCAEAGLDKMTRCTIYPVAASGVQRFASLLEKETSSPIQVIHDLRRQLEHLAGPKSNECKLAIIGFSGRFPEANNLEQFWHLLRDGRDVHREIPEDRFDVAAHFDSTGKRKNTSRVKHGCFIREPGLFDERFFNMSPREAANADPAQRLAITTAYEAMEMAGFVPDRTVSSRRDRVGVFYGMTSDDWREVNSGQDVDTYFIPGGNRAFTPGRLNYYFKFSGPSYSIDTACSSSLAALNAACNCLWLGDCDTAFVGGVNIMTNPDNFAGLDRGHFLSTTGNCSTFDDAANGYCRADAIGTVILKRLEDAEADGDPIQAVILASGTNHSADAESMTRPHTGAQVALLNRMLSATGTDSRDVSYVEMHGTGTQAGDATEMRTMLEVFAPNTQLREGCPLYVGSVKANVGHSESASGITALIKVLLMMRANSIPPNIGIKSKVNHNFPANLHARNLHIPTTVTEWQAPLNVPRTAFINNFSAAGGNSSVLIQEPQRRGHQQLELDPRTHFVVTISAKSATALQNNQRALLQWLESSPNVSLSSLAYTLAARRIHYKHRKAYTVANIGSLRRELAAPHSQPISRQRSTVFVYTGQGILRTGMARFFMDHFVQFKSDVYRFDKVAQESGYGSFIGLLEGSQAISDNLSPVTCQLAHVAMQMALTKLWQSWGLVPSAVVGHSLGEFAAMHCAGMLSASEVICLVGARAALLEQRCERNKHSMLGVRESAAALERRFGSSLPEIACVNGPDDTVLSGPDEQITSIYEALSASRVKSVRLAVPYAFHSTQVEPILSSFAELCQSVILKDPAIPYISPLEAGILQNASAFGTDYLARACRGKVDFCGAVQAAMQSQVVDSSTIWLELGPHPVCTPMLKEILGSETLALPTTSIKQDQWKVLADTLAGMYSAGVELDWTEHYANFPKTDVLELPTYAWDLKNHWIEYRNNFCLTKGDEPQKQLVVPLRPQSNFNTTASCQTVVCESPGCIEVESDLAAASLKGVVRGHVVNRAMLCPSSLWADVALTLASYLTTQSGAMKSETGFDVSNMTVLRPLVATGATQLYRASAKLSASRTSVAVTISSVDKNTSAAIQHAHCVVQIEDTTHWRKDWKRLARFVKARIDTLHDSKWDQNIHQINRGMAYKLFRALVAYDASYQGMQRVALHSSQHEASAIVSLQCDPHKDFYLSPCCIDSLGHLAGFTMNANEKFESQDHVFVNHGWDGMKVSKALSTSSIYHTYVAMTSADGKLYSGDVYTLEGQDVVAVYYGVKFQMVPRQFLDQLLPSSRQEGSMTAKFSNAARTVSQRQQRPSEKRTPRRGGPKTSRPQPGLEQPNVVARALAIIAEEVGIKIKDLSPDTEFDDLGLDSLLSLNVAERLREELNLIIDSSFWAKCHNVQELVSYLESSKSEMEGGRDASGSIPVSPSLTASDSEASSTSSRIFTDLSLDQDSDEPSDSEVDPRGTISAAMIRRLIGEELGIAEHEVSSSTPFEEMGLDSLMSLNLMSRLQEACGVDVPSTLFSDCPNLEDVLTKLGIVVPQKIEPSIIASTPPKLLPRAADLPPASSVLLQGNPAKASKKLFLFPDGSGSATSYLELPDVSKDVAVYGLNCPFLKDPAALKHRRLDELTGPYLAEIRKRQPHGPYNLGGWSAGGICAYDAAQRLMAEGEHVDRLFLLDTPFPIGLGKLPPRLYEYLNELKLFGEGKPPAWLLPHFLAFIDALDTYGAVPFGDGKAPETYLVWAAKGVCEGSGIPVLEAVAGDPKEVEWLLRNRSDLGPNGWDCLVGSARLKVQVMARANHFDMVRGEGAAELSALLRQALRQ